MKVALDTSPLTSGHKIRGIGSYTQNLFSQLRKQTGLQIFPFEVKPPANVDLIHYPYFDLFFHTLPEKSKIKRVITIHDVIPLVFPKHFPAGLRGKINLFLQKKALKNTDAVICDSETSKKDVVERLSYPAEKIHVVYLAPGSLFKKVENVSLLREVAVRLKLPDEFILYVGDVNWNKNLKNLLDAVKIAKCNLVMVGSSLTNLNIEQSQEIQNQITKLGIEKNIYRTGYVKEKDLIAVYSLATVTMQPSFYEGFGLSVLQSMACGTPVICSDNSSLSEITGNLATYCDPSDPDNIAQNITAMLNFNRSKKAVQSQKLMNYARNFKWEKVASETVKIYKEIINK